MIRIIHHLARTGGTLLSKCVGCMQGVHLLSEINPLGVDKFHPLRQACDWHDLVGTDEVREVNNAGQFWDAIELIQQRSEDRGHSLVVRDWSHLDFLGFPFHSEPTHTFSLVPPTPHRCRRIVTVRNPLDHYLSLSKLNVLKKDWDEQRVWDGMLAFAKASEGMDVFRFEDFVSRPTATMEQICARLDLTFDPTFIDNWQSYRKITGDNGTSGSIERRSRKPVPDAVWKRLSSNEAYFEILDRFGYPKPMRFRGGVHPLIHDFQAEIEEPETSDPDAWIHYYRSRLTVDPTDREASLEVSKHLMEVGEHDAAWYVLRSLLEKYPTDVEALYQAIKCLTDLGRKFDVISLRRQLAKQRPGDFQNLFSLAHGLSSIGAVTESLTYYRHLVDRQKGNDAAATNYLLGLNYSDQHSASEIANEHFRIGMRFTERPEDLPPRVRADDGRIRIGYVSSDFQVHPVGKILRGLLTRHDRSIFRISAYSSGKKQDLVSRQCADAVDEYIDVAKWSDNELYEKIQTDQIDVLLDLGAYTAGGNRLRVFARRAAPIQISFLGYPNTSALQTIDYRITDRFADPPGLIDQLYGEQSIWMDSGILAWEPYECVQQVRESIQNRRVDGPPTIGAFNNVAKISPSAIRCWAQILRRSPDVTLVLKYGDRYEEAIVRDRFCRLFAECGVRSDRLRFDPLAKSLESHLKGMASVDLALDSFPYQGTMTSLECLSVGTPILSLAGEYYAHRATSAMMMRLGMIELIAESEEEYVEIATQLLADRELLRDMREGLADAFHASTLVQPDAFVGELENKLASLVTFCES